MKFPQLHKNYSEKTGNAMSGLYDDELGIGYVFTFTDSHVESVVDIHNGTRWSCERIDETSLVPS